MNTNHDDNNPLHLTNEPELQQIESMLDAMGQADRDAMSHQSHDRVLEAISGVFAPAAISIEQAQPSAGSYSQSSARWKLRAAAAVLLVTGVSLSLLVIKPWSTTTISTPQSNAGTWTLASFEQDLDAYMALDEVGDESLDDAVANWELWAQTIDTDLDTELLGSGLGLTDLNDGAL